MHDRRIAPSHVALVAVVGALAFILVAVLQWVDVGPLGSDNDEYREVARALLRGDGPVTGGGIEGTKYPLGQPLLLALFDLVGLPVTGTAIVVNLVAIAVFVALTAAVAHLAVPSARPGQWTMPAVAMVLFLLVNPTLWEMAGLAMPDALALALTAGVLFVATWEPSRRRAIWLVALVVVAMAMKSLAVLLVPTAMVALLFDRREGAERWRPWAAGAAGGALLVLVAGALAVAGQPEHTTGYAATFFLENPGDASLGEVGIGGVLARLVTRLDVVATVGGKAVIGPDFATSWTWPVSLALVVAGIVGTPRLRRELAVYTTAYVGVLALWPYQSTRLSSPILPVAALGVHAMARRLFADRSAAVRVTALLLSGMLIAALATANVQRIRDDAERERANAVALERDLGLAVDFLLDHGAGDRDVVSFDYREVAYRLDRAVLPLGYTSDVDDLRAASVEAGARWLVVVDGFAPSRVVLGRLLLRSSPGDFTLVLDTDRVDIHEIRR